MRLRSVTPGGAGTLIDPEKYTIVRQAILTLLPADGDGVTWAALAEMIAPHLPDSLFRHAGSVRWYTRAVELDLESEGLIESVPQSDPPRLRRVA